MVHIALQFGNGLTHGGDGIFSARLGLAGIVIVDLMDGDMVSPVSRSVFLRTR
jgi:hypothetical protein